MFLENLKMINANRIAIGTAQFGMNYGINNARGKIPYEEVVQILRYAKESGIDTLDTAYNYGDSEKVLGETINRNGFNFKVISKLPKDISLEDVNSSFCESLNRLKQSKIYGYLIHDFQSFKNQEYILEALKKLKEQGKIEKIGFSLYYPSELDFLFEKKINVDIIQFPYSIFDQRFEQYFSRLKDMNVEIYVRSVFLQGLLLKQPEEMPSYFDKIKEKVIILNRIAENNNMSLSFLCLKFVLMTEFVDKVVIGVDNIENLKENLQAIEKGIDLDCYNFLKSMKIEDEDIIIPYKWQIN